MAIKEKARKVLQKAVKVCRSSDKECNKCPLYYKKDKTDNKSAAKEKLCNTVSKIAMR